MTFENVAGVSISEVQPIELTKEEGFHHSWVVPTAGKGFLMANQSLTEPAEMMPGLEAQPR